MKAGEGKRVRQLAELVPPDQRPRRRDGGAQRRRTSRQDRRVPRIASPTAKTLDDLLLEAFAVVREGATRVLGQRHYDVQLMGGMALHFGWIAEMKTGEGKTLVSTLPVYLNALAGKGVHVVTVNDYLATRDANWMGAAAPLPRAHGRSRRTGPRLDFGGEARGLRLPTSPTARTPSSASTTCATTWPGAREHMVQRGHHYAIVDEVDSILIDEARTPLIISGPASDVTKLYYQFASIARALTRDVDYEVDEEKKTVVPTEAGIEKVEQQLGVTNLYDAVATNYVHQLGQALRAKELFHRDKDYLVDAGEVKIVDEFTGRTLDGRRWSDGLHQAVEAKERVRIQEENHTWATVTLQNYFRLYEKLAGMTGTAETEAAEFGNTYKLSVVPIPTNQPLIRLDQPDLIYKTESAKFAAIVDDVRERSDLGQPVLLGTASVEKSELLSRELSKAGIATRGPERQAALPRGRDRGPGRTQARGHGRDQHGRSRRRRHARRQLRGTRRARGQGQGFAPDTEEYDAAYAERAGEVARAITEAEGDEVRAARGPLRARHRATRLATHRQPVARSIRASGRPGREPLLSVARGRAVASLRHRRRLVGDGPHDARRRAHRGQDGLQGHRARPEHRRGHATPRSARTCSSTTK